MYHCHFGKHHSRLNFLVLSDNYKFILTDLQSQYFLNNFIQKYNFCVKIQCGFQSKLGMGCFSYILNTLSNKERPHSFKQILPFANQFYSIYYHFFLRFICLRERGRANRKRGRGRGRESQADSTSSRVQPAT